MQFRYILILAAALAVSGCAFNPGPQSNGAKRMPVNTPALMADLQAVRNAADLRTLEGRYARQVSLTVAKAVELYVPADYAVFPETGVDLSKMLLLDRSRTWSDALPAALDRIGIETTLDPANKTVQLAPAKMLIPTADR